MNGDFTEQERLEAARAYAQWELGAPGWADSILRAFNNPAATLERLRAAGYGG